METKTKIRNFRVTRKAIVTLKTDIITCSNPVTAVIATDNLTNYEETLRQLTRDGVIIEVELDKLSGAIVEEVDGDNNHFDFEEEDLEDVKAVVWDGK